MPYRPIVPVLALALLAAAPASPAAEPEVVVRLDARKFHYTPREIVLKRGVPVVLELTALDRVHGFNLPDFGLRADLVPGQVTRLRLTPDKTGTFVFFCDVFCGDGHEEMNGTLTIKE
jgi:cytochrome c oxidase subunit 2